MRDDPWFRVLTILGVAAVGFHLAGEVWQIASHFSDIIVIFFLAWLLAFILSPLAGYFERWLAVSRGVAAGIIYIALLLFIVVGFVIVIPMALDQIVQLANSVPAVVKLAQSWIAFFQAEFVARGLSVDLPTIYRSTDLTSQVGSLATGIVANSIGLVSGVASAVFGILVVLIISFYLVLDGERALRRILGILPTDNASERYFFASINRTFGGFLRGTLFLASLNALGIALVMWVAGLGYVIIGAILAFFLTLIPLIGSLLALITPVLLAALLGDTTKVIVVLAVLFIYQLILFNIFWPKVIGDRMGLHPVLVFLALLVGAKEAGFVGAVFGGPIAAVLYAMGMYLLDRRPTGQQAASEGSTESDAEAVRPPTPPRRRFLAERLWPRLRERLGTLYRRISTAILAVVLRLRGGPEHLDAGH